MSATERSSQEPATAPVTLAEIIAAISLAADLGLGQPVEHMLRTCLLATRFCDHLGVESADRDATYWVTLFVSAGCTGASHELSQVFGDDIELRAGAYRAAPTDIAQLRYFLGRAGSDRGLLGRTAIRAELLGTRMKALEESLTAHCRLSATLAERLGLGATVTSALHQAFARWDGKGLPRGLRGEAIALPMRICILVDAAEVLHRERGLADCLTTLQSARGMWFDPALVDAWCGAAAELAPDATEPAFEQVVAAAPSGSGALSEAQLDDALEVLADYADLKSPWFTGHSRGVADLAARAGHLFGLGERDVRTLRRAALVHDIGRNGVPNSIWDKPGPLTEAELERVRLHAYYTDRVLRRSGGLAGLAAVASSAHERGGGTGYPRAISGATIPLLGRLLEAADAYHAMREERPHRGAHTAADAERELRRGVRAGEFDAAAVDAVLAAAGHAARRRRSSVAGLSPRETEVLVLVARGLTNRQIAHRLAVTPKTAGNYVERIYAKIDASSRAEAAMFAMRHGLVADDQL